MPSTWTVPSLPRPPRDVKKKFVAVPPTDWVEFTSSVNDWTPGTIARTLPYGARHRNGGEHFVGKDDLALRARLRVNDRRRSGHRNRLLDRSDPHVGIDRRDAGARQLDVIALHCGKSGQRERHAVRAGFQIDESVLARPIGHNGA
jgi:hypothetical protein